MQGYVYAHKLTAAKRAEVLGNQDGGRALRADAERRRQALEKRFWCDDLGVYALALDGDKWLFFFFNDTATTEIYTLSLHDALPISPPASRATPPRRRRGSREAHPRRRRSPSCARR